MSEAAPSQDNLSKVTLYHKIEADKVDHTLKSGLFRSKPGDKEDTLIVKTNNLLDKLTPKSLLKLGVQRTEALYMYYAKDGEIINITDGDAVAIDHLPLEEGQALIEVSIPPTHCFVSDLDQFDYVMWLIKHNDIDQAEDEAKLYWQSLTPLSRYTDDIDRPEVIVTQDINPTDLTLKLKNDSS